MEKITRIYLTPVISRGVAVSQIFNWGKFIEEKGIHTKYLIFYDNLGKIDEMADKNDSDIIPIKLINKPIIRDLQIIFSVFNIIRRSFKSNDKVILQTRHSLFYIAFLLFHKMPKVKTILELRGAGENIYRSTLHRYRINYRFNLICAKSDLIYCVSEKLKTHLCDKYGINRKKIMVFHGAAEIKTFFYDKMLREKLRKELKISNKIILIYSGQLDKPWQIPEKIFELFSKLRKRIPNLYLIILTFNVDIAKAQSAKFNIKNDEILIKTVEYEELNKYYNAADFGLLLREDKLVNNVASPTKFCEYILSGLPTIITDRLGDFSDMVDVNNLGITIKDIRNIDQDIKKVSDYLHNFSDVDNVNDERKRISDFGKENLSKEKLVKKYLKAYKEL